MKFTKALIESIPLPEKGNRIIKWDSEVKGFGVRVTQNGRMYIVQRRVNGILRQISIGRHGEITLQQARSKAQLQLGKMSGGEDPTEEKNKAASTEKTLRILADEYIKAHKELKLSSITGINKHIDKSFKDWSKKPAVEITRENVAVKFRKLTDKGPAQANQAMKILRAIFNFARAAYRPAFTENPVGILSETKVWNSVYPRSGRIPTNKIGASWNLLQALRFDEFSTKGQRTAADITAFLMLTGARWSEAAELTWDRVNLEERFWYLPDPKNRQPVMFPLSDESLALLQKRERESNFVFPSSGKTGHLKSAVGPFKKISDAAKTIITPHDMRRTFRAIGGECQIELWKIKLLMNHKMSQDVTISAYTETSDLRYLAPEINKITEWITKEARIAASSNVVPMQAGLRE